MDREALRGMRAQAGPTAARPRQARSAATSLLILLPLSCLAATVLLGVAVGAATAAPRTLAPWLSMQIVQPLHTLMAMLWLITGVGALVVLVLRRAGAPGAARLGRVTGCLNAAFVACAAASVARGGTGVEYIAWSAGVSALAVATFALLAWAFFSNLRAVSRWSPEGAWLIGVGILLLPLGLVERHLGLREGLDFSRRLSVEWHSLDTAFAGINLVVYGAGVLMARPAEGAGAGPPLRPLGLYLLAAFALLSTFGHHHYMSPQAESMKVIAVAASMLGAVSFIRHARAARHALKARGEPGRDPFVAAAELWTPFAIGTGVLIAVPQVNLVVHGTHAIVAHSMGSMIGVDTLLILGGIASLGGLRRRDGWKGSPVNDPMRRGLARRLRWVSILLALVCTDLLAAGVAKGFLRMSEPFAAFQPVILLILAPLPLLGAALGGALLWLAAGVLRPSLQRAATIRRQAERAGAGTLVVTSRHRRPQAAPCTPASP